MIILLHYTSLLCLLLASNYLLAQPIIKEKRSLAYIISSTDSIVRSQKSSTYDDRGVLLNSKNYYYNISKPGVLIKEESINFNPNNSVLTETITRYPTGKEPQTERLETKYLVYAPQEKNSKRIWRRHFDHYGELTREDTLTYNEDTLLVNNCQYNYMGSTSILCEEYQYKESLRKRWLTYSKWNTINGRSQVVEKQTKRRDYRYFHNRHGQLKRIRAKEYGNKIRRRLCYDKKGKLEKDHFIMKRKVSKSVKNSKEKKTNKKQNYIQKTETIILYEAGKKVSMQQLVDRKEIRKETFLYKDSLLLKEQILENGKRTEEHLYTYVESVLTESSKNKYDDKDYLYYTIKTFYNTQALPIRREQIAQNTLLSVQEWTYNNYGQVLSKTTSRPAPTNTKKHTQTIDRPKEKIVYIYSYH